MGLRLCLVVAATAALAACGGEDGRPATFSYIHSAILEPNCTTSACHSSVSAVGELDLEAREDAYEALTGRACGSPPGDDRDLVNPGQPASSRLMYLLIDEEVPRPMPPDLPLPEADIDLIEQWILEGAPCT